MTASSPLLDLDDAASIVAADSQGVMRAAALGGAQVRSVAEAVAEGVLDSLRDQRPRSVILVTAGGRAARAAAVLVAAVAPRLGFPIVHVPAVPSWLGSLDVVVVAGEDAGHPDLVAAADSALRRGAELVVVAPDEGPLRAAAAGGGMLFESRIRVPDRHGFPRFLAAGLAVLAALGSGSGGALPDLADLADQLDAEAARNHPSAEVFHNPAKSLAVRLQGRRAVFTGDDRASTELARHAAEMMLVAAGTTAAAAELSDVLASAALLSGGGEMPVGYDPIFHDEELDGPAPVAPARVFVLATSRSRTTTMRRLAALPDAELVTDVADGEQHIDVDRLRMRDADTIDPAGGGPADRWERSEVEQLAVLSIRLEMAAGYLRLIGGR